MSGVTAVPLAMPAQSIFTWSAICAGVGAGFRTGGFPWGAMPEPFCVYPGFVGTATPATAGSLPHASAPPVPMLDAPFLCSPLRLVQLDRMLIVPGCHTAYSATVRSAAGVPRRSEEHTSELQSRLHLVCRLLLEKKKNKHT